jgi:hypothetical protein
LYLKKGELGGPGSFPNAYLPSIRIKNPSKPSTAFLSPQTFNKKNNAENSALFARTAELKKFSEEHKSGPMFLKNGDDNIDKNELLTLKVKQKISKIYPRLIKKKKKLRNNDIYV